MAGKLAEFAVELKAKDAGLSMTLKTAVERLSQMRLVTLGEITALGVLGNMFKDVGMHAMDMSSGYTKLNQELGVNTDLLQRWQNVARASNVAPQAVASGLAHIKQVMAGFRHGSGDPEFMKGAAFLGMSNVMSMSESQILQALRKAVPAGIRASKTGREDTWDALRRMGLGDMMQSFELGNSKFNKAYNRPIESAESIKNFTELNNQLAILTNEFFLLAETIESLALPKLLEWGQALIDSKSYIEQRYGKAARAAEAPYVSGGGLLGTPFGHAIASLVAPDLTSKVSRQSIQVTQHNKTDIHMHGDNSEEKAKRHFDKNNQSHLTTALQAGDTQVVR